jgi:hypothetical protein
LFKKEVFGSIKQWEKGSLKSETVNMAASPKDSEPRKTALARASSICKIGPVLSSERASHKNKTVTVKQ